MLKTLAGRAPARRARPTNEPVIDLTDGGPTAPPIDQEELRALLMEAFARGMQLRTILGS